MGQLVCIECGASFALDEPRWRCRCGGLLDLEWQPKFDLDRIASRPPTMWRYREAIPIAGDHQVISLDEGFTPLLPMSIGGRNVWVKQDQLFSTGSYKDRGASVLISQAAALGVERVVEDSSGNAGCAIAAYCARAGIECAIYVPETTSPGKLVQIETYGAELHRIPGSREDTADAAFAAAQDTYYASHSWNPFFFHGTKTFAFEVCEQLGWRAPDLVVLPAGNGTLLLGAAIGFRELVEAGVIERVPRLIAVQAAACAPLYVAWEKGLDHPDVVHKQPTLAEGIAIAEPVRGPQIVQAVRASGGTFLTVTEDEIRASWRSLGAQGFFVEPTAAATAAGVLKAIDTTPEGWVVVSVFTGHGLKAAVGLDAH